MTDPRSELGQIRQRAENATTGPWDAVERASVYIPFHWGAVKAHVETDANAEFIAASRSDVPRLVAFALAVLDLADRDRIDVWAEQEYPNETIVIDAVPVHELRTLAEQHLTTEEDGR